MLSLLKQLKAPNGQLKLNSCADEAVTVVESDWPTAAEGNQLEVL